MGGDIKGGGMTIYETNTQANPSLQYGEGLTVPNPSAHMELDQLINTGTYGKVKSYDRGIIFHYRSNATQYITYHAFFGGFRKSVVERWFVRYFWRTLWSRALPAYAVLWTFQVIGHRDYDNNAYAYFYFSD